MKKSANKNIKFSVLMSVYYKEKPEHLDLALESVLDKQTLKPDEVIIVKDGKLTDGLEEVLKKYKAKYPKVISFIELEKNSGLGVALNMGIDKCKYDLVMRMDTDDISCPDRFEKQIMYMEKHPDVSILGGTIGEFYNSPEEKLRIKKMPLNYEEVFKYSKFRNPLNHMTVCFRKKDVLDVGSYKPMLYLEDLYLWSRMLIAGKKIENIPDLLVKVRIGNGFYDRRGSKEHLKGWRELQKFLNKSGHTNFLERNRNVASMYALVYSPKWIRKVVYDRVLRKDVKK